MSDQLDDDGEEALEGSGDEVPIPDMPFEEAIVRPLMSELEVETDQGRALRRALLGMILLAQKENVSPGVAAFVDYLLLAFGPLREHFNDEDQHLLVRGHSVMVWAEQFEGEPGFMQLLLHQDAAHQLYREAWERRLSSLVEHGDESLRRQIRELLDEQFP
ncbi:MAG: hypothetical protein M3Q71_07320 [Chloroflexota bacterium]|nr:hypothetical protein [Chloroflexota bacterium]MDP9470462.1 hypothetical protein [Chloroflexota bacterium]